MVRFGLVLTAVAAIHCSGPAFAQETPDPVLAGAIDTHVHSEEEYRILDGGSGDMVQIVRRAQEKGMRGIVFKSLKFETATRAYIAQKQVPGIQVFGGVTLDLSVGGMNPEAIEAVAKMKLPNMKMVWMPVFDSAAGERAAPDGKVAAVSANGRLTPAALATLDAIARHGYSVGTSHLGADEALMVVRAARERQIPVVVTHAAQAPVSMALEQMQEAARLGAYIEHTAFGVFKGQQGHLRNPFYRNQHQITYDETVRLIRAVGAEHTILATDMGQADSPLPPDGLKGFILSLKERGITDAEIDLMVRRNPARLLELTDAGQKVP